MEALSELYRRSACISQGIGMPGAAAEGKRRSNAHCMAVSATLRTPCCAASTTSALRGGLGGIKLRRPPDDVKTPACIDQGSGAHGVAAAGGLEVHGRSYVGSVPIMARRDAGRHLAGLRKKGDGAGLTLQIETPRRVAQMSVSPCETAMAIVGELPVMPADASRSMQGRCSRQGRGTLHPKP